MPMSHLYCCPAADRWFSPPSQTVFHSWDPVYIMNSTLGMILLHASELLDNSISTTEMTHSYNLFNEGTVLMKLVALPPPFLLSVIPCASLHPLFPSSCFFQGVDGEPFEWQPGQWSSLVEFLQQLYYSLSLQYCATVGCRWGIVLIDMVLCEIFMVKCLNLWHLWPYATKDKVFLSNCGAALCAWSRIVCK